MDRPQLRPLALLLALVSLLGCQEPERRAPRTTQRPPRAPSAATLANCHAMHPTDAETAQACLQRWLVGGPLSTPVTPAPQAWEPTRTHDDWVARVALGCAQEAGMSASHPITPSEMLRFTTCVERERARRFR